MPCGEGSPTTPPAMLFPRFPVSVCPWPLAVSPWSWSVMVHKVGQRGLLRQQRALWDLAFTG